MDFDVEGADRIPMTKKKTCCCSIENCQCFRDGGVGEVGDYTLAGSLPFAVAAADGTAEVRNRATVAPQQCPAEASDTRLGPGEHHGRCPTGGRPLELLMRASIIVSKRIRSSSLFAKLAVSNVCSAFGTCVSA